MEQIYAQQNRNASTAFNQSLIEPNRTPNPKCPICGEELHCDEKVYVLGNGDEVLGCENCIKRYDAGDFLGG